MAIDLKKLQDRLYDVSPSHTPPSIDIGELRNQLRPYRQVGYNVEYRWNPMEETARFPAVQQGRYLALPQELDTSSRGFDTQAFLAPSRAIAGTLGQSVVNIFRTTLDSLERVTDASMKYPREFNVLDAWSDVLSSGSVSGAFETMGGLINESTSIYTNLINKDDTQWSQILRPVEESLAEWADLDSQNIATKISAQVVSIAPYLISMKLGSTAGAIGAAAAFSTIYNNIFSNKVESAVKQGHKRTDPKVNIYASADAALRMGTLYAFNALAKVNPAGLTANIGARTQAYKYLLSRTKEAPIELGKASLATYYKSARAFIRAVGQQAQREVTATGAQWTIGSLAKYFSQNIVARASGEVVYNIGSGIIAHNTIAKDHELYTQSSEEGGLISADGIRDSAITGALMGFAIAFATGYKSFTNTNTWVKNNSSQRIGIEGAKLGDGKTYNNFTQALKKDMQNPVNQKLVLRQASSNIAQSISDSAMSDAMSMPTSPITQPATGTARPVGTPEVSAPSQAVATPSTPAVEPSVAMQERQVVQPPASKEPVRTKAIENLIDEFDTAEPSPEYRVPDESYNQHLMELARKILSPARFDVLKEGLRGRFTVIEGEKKGAIKVESIAATRVMAHEIGHSLDYNLNRREMKRTLQQRFPDANLSETRLREEAKKISQVMRPTDEWTKYRDKPSELMADVYSMYLLDQDKLRQLSTTLYDAINRQINDSEYKDAIKTAIGNVTYKKPSKAAQAIKAAKTIERVDPLAKSAKDMVGSRVIRTDRRRKAAIAEAKFVGREWQDKYTERELEDVGALVEDMRNITTGKMPVRTDRLQELETEYRYRIEKIREDINKMLVGVGDDQYINFIENYLPHFYVYDKKKFSNFTGKFFSKNVKSAKPRVFPTYKEAMEEGLVPLTQNIAKLYQKYVDINLNAAFNAELIKDIHSDSAKLDTPIFTTEKLTPDQVKIDHPAFARIFATKNAKGETVLWRGGVWIDKDTYRPLRQIIEKPFDNTALKTALKITALMKNTSLTLSFFHYGNITESAQAILASFKNPLGGVITSFQGKPMFSFKAGQSLANEPEVVKDALLHGLQVDPFSDAMVGMVKNMYMEFEARSKKIPMLSGTMKAMRKGNEFMQHNLWNKYVTPLKIYSYWKLVGDFIAKAPKTLTDAQLTRAKEIIAEYLNDGYGGQEWASKFWATPKARQLLQLVMMAPDYTISNFNIAMKRPFEILSNAYKGYYGKTYGEENPQFKFEETLKNKKFAGYWVHMLLSLYISLGVLQYALNKNYIWDNEPDQGWSADVTPVYRALGKIIPGYDPGERRYYMSPGKQFKEVIRYFTDPFEILGAKMSPLSRTLIEQLTKVSPGSGWETSFKDMGWYESIPHRLYSIMEKFIPFSLQGSNFLMTFPLRKGMSWYKAQKAYEDVIRAQVDPNLYQKLLGPDNAKRLKEQIDRGAELNGLDPEEQWKNAMSAVRTTYYADFWKAINEDKMDKAEKYAKILIELESNWSRIKTSGTNRKMTEEEIAKARNLYKEIEKNK